MVRDERFTCWKPKEEKESPLDHGPAHYRAGFVIQPIEFIVKNKIPFCEANVIKYVCRWKKKGGKEDLKKAKHYLDILLELDN